MNQRGNEGAINVVLGDALFELGERPQALVSYQHALDLLETLNAKGDNIRVVANAMIVTGKIGDILLMEEKNSEAIASYSKAEKVSRRLAAADPHNALLQQLVVNDSAQLGHAFVEAGRMEEGLPSIRKALAVAETAPAQTPLIRTLQGDIHVWFGEALEHEGKIRETSHQYAKGKELVSAVRTGGTNDLRIQLYLSSSMVRWAAALGKLGKIAEARKEYEQALGLLEPLSLANPGDTEVLYALAETCTGEGTISAKVAEGSNAPKDKLANWKAARDWFQKSLNTWRKVPNSARISTSGIEATLPDEVSRRLAECDAQLAPTSAEDGQLSITSTA